MSDPKTNQLGLFELPPPGEASAAPAPVRTTKPKVKRPAAATPLAAAAPAAALKKAPPRNSVHPRPKTSGLVPAGDVRLTANIAADIHLTLKLVAAHRRTTIGELIEELVENYLESPYVRKK